MGIFSRKNMKASNSGDKSPVAQAEDVQSPRSFKPPAGASFGPLPTVIAPKAPDPSVDPAAYLRSIFSVRERCALVSQKARRNQLMHFDVDMSKWSETAQYVVAIIKVSNSNGRFIVRMDFNSNVARLCSRLQQNSTTWSMAAF